MQVLAHSPPRRPAGWLLLAMALALVLQPNCFSHVAEAQPLAPPSPSMPLAPSPASPPSSPPRAGNGSSNASCPVNENWTGSCKQWGEECTTIRNLYSLWFPPADQVKKGPCTLVCNSTTNVVSCDPPPPSDSPCACALYSPTNYTGL
ncbi:unnamed protein product [Closterium sp. NIES-53]